MSAQLPPHIVESEEIAYVNQLVTAHLGRNTRTNEKVVIMRGGPAVGPRMRVAEDALHQISSLADSPEGLPTVLHADDGQEGVALVLSDVHGVPAYRRLLKLETYSEEELLLIAERQVNLLIALHGTGFSGLRPTTRELWLDASTKAVTFLGWEWVNPHIEDVQGDIRHTATLWVELCTGFAPLPHMEIEGGTHQWISLSLATRQLLVRLIREPRVANAAALGQLISRRRQELSLTESELLDLCRAQRAQIPKEALPVSQANAMPVAQSVEVAVHTAALLDMGKRKFPRQPAFARMFDAVQAQIQQIPAALILQGKHLLRLGQYTDAHAMFERVAGNSHTFLPDLALALARWRTTAQILVALGEVGLSRENWVSPLSEATEFACSGRFEDALARLNPLPSQLPDDIHLSPLSALRSEIELQIEWNVAQEARAKGKHKEAAQRYRDIAAKEVHIICWIEVLRMRGASPATQAEESENLLASEIRSKQQHKKAITSLERAKYDDAQRYAREAAHSSRNNPGLLHECAEIEHKAVLRAGIKLPEIGQTFADFSWPDIENVAARMAGYRGLYPTDAWATQIWNQLRDCLVAIEDRQFENQNNRLLHRYWGQEAAVKLLLAERVVLLLGTIHAIADDIEGDLVGIWPGRAQSHLTQLTNCYTQMQTHRYWLQEYAQADQIDGTVNRLVQCRKRVKAILESQKSLRESYESAIRQGMSGHEQLEEAGKVEIELHDEPFLSVAHLRLRVSARSVKTHSDRSEHLEIALSAWRAGQPAGAKSICEAILQDSGSRPPDKVAAQTLINLLNADLPLTENVDTSGFTRARRDETELEILERNFRHSLVMLLPNDSIRKKCLDVYQKVLKNEWQEAQDGLTRLGNPSGKHKQKCVEQCTLWVNAYLENRRQELLSQIMEHSLGAQKLTDASTKNQIAMQVKLLHALDKLTPNFSGDEKAKVKDALLKNLDADGV